MTLDWKRPLGLESVRVTAVVNNVTDAKLSTQAEPARRFGTTQSAVARLESGGISPSIKTLLRYAEATGRNKAGAGSSAPRLCKPARLAMHCLTPGLRNR